jgi:DNA invertase Pin-like site-specific DNA recombinase
MTVNFEIGYARVSREDQNLDLQIDAILKRGVDEKQIFKEKVSGVSKKRPQFALCLKRLRRGDTLVVWKLDRLGRSLTALCELSKSFDNRGIMLVSITEGIDTTTAMGKLFFHFMAAIAQFERDLIGERTKAGIEAARNRGTWRSRPVTFTKEQYDTALEVYRDDNGLSIKEIARQSGLKMSTATKHIEKIKAGVAWQWGDNTVANQKRKKR